VGALVLVTGAVGGAVVMEARAKREAQEKQASAAASTPRPQGSAVRELANEGIYINPPTIEKTGTFTTTQICSGPNDLKFTKATFTVQDGPAILVQGGCEVTVIDSQIARAHRHSHHVHRVGSRERRARSWRRSPASTTTATSSPSPTPASRPPPP
jgi:hypothetical protein